MRVTAPEIRTRLAVLTLPSLLAISSLLGGCGPGAGWEPLGGSQNAILGPRMHVSAPAVAVSSTGDVVLAWVEQDGNVDPRPTVQRWVENAWHHLWDPGIGLPGHPLADSRMALALDRVDQPVVAWAQISSDGATMDILVSRLDAALEWSLLGTRGVIASLRSTPVNRVSAPALAIDPSGFPVVAWVEMGTDNRSRLFVARWNGAAWEQMGRDAVDSQLDGFSTELALLMDDRGYPAVLWRLVGDGVSRLLRWDGRAWSAVGGALELSGGAGVRALPAVAFSGNTPLMAVSHPPTLGDSGGRVDVRRWTGSTWERLGTSLSGSTDPIAWPRAPVMCTDNLGNPVIAWTESPTTNHALFVRRWTGTDWKDLGVLHASTSNGILKPALAMNSLNQVVVAWKELVGTNSTLRVAMRLDR